MNCINTIVAAPNSALTLMTLSLLAGNAVAQSRELEFAPSLIEPDARVYELKPERKVPLDAVQFIDPERLAATLMELLPIRSQSCREQPIAAAARTLLLKAAGTQSVTAEIDDLARRYTALDREEQQELGCDNGKTPPQSGNVVATLAGDPGLPSWNLSVHLDTNQIQFEGFRRDGDRILPPPGSPLGADDKAGLAIILEVVQVIADGKLPHGDIRIVGLVAEEDSAAGAQLIDGSAFKGDILVSIDGGDPQTIGRAAPTNYNGYLTVRTRTSHPASVHEKKSVSACAVGTRILHEAGFRPESYPPDHPDVVLHSYFMSCGIDNGRLTPKGEPIADYQYNSISPFWTVAWQMRSLEGGDAARDMALGIKATVERVCAAAAAGRTPIECAITGTERPGLLGYVIAEDAPAIQLLKTAFKNADAGVASVTARQFGGFNGNYVKQRFGEEMLLMGTGGDQAHTNEETVSVKGMALAARVLLAAILESARYEKFRMVD